VRAVHHLDLWVAEPAVAAGEWGWLLGELGWEVDLDGVSWVHDDGTYVFLERSADQVDAPYDRMRPGMNPRIEEVVQRPSRNHVALTCDSRELLDRVRSESAAHGWHELFADRYPHAGGEQHTALYLENSEGFEVEVVLARQP
jgi:hypothetical protein